MSPVARRMRAAVGVLNAEGPRAAFRRAQDHAAEWQRRRRFVHTGTPLQSGFEAPVLNVLTAPPAPWSGGVATSFQTRRAVEETLRPCAVLFPEAAGYRLELSATGVRCATALEDASFEDAVRRAADLVSARALHFEGTQGLPVASLLRLAHGARPVIVSIHDFSLFCRRPHLAEWPGDRFCEYSREADRCAACLRHTWSVPDDFQEQYRATSGELLRSAAAVVYPSHFMQQSFAHLFPDVVPARPRVIHPASSRPATAAGVPSPLSRAIALVGAVHRHKGARIFEEVARRLVQRTPAVRMEVMGGGDPDALQRLRQIPGIRTSGYYRAGSLGAQLRHRGIGLALLLSIVPESYCMALDECLASGVPVIAFDHGAAADRLRAHGGGLLVALSDGAAGVLDAVERVLDGRLPLTIPEASVLALPTPASAARAHVELYAELLPST